MPYGVSIKKYPLKYLLLVRKKWLIVYPKIMENCVVPTEMQSAPHNDGYNKIFYFVYTS